MERSDLLIIRTNSENGVTSVATLKRNEYRKVSDRASSIGRQPRNWINHPNPQKGERNLPRHASTGCQFTRENSSGPEGLREVDAVQNAVPLEGTLKRRHAKSTSSGSRSKNTSASKWVDEYTIYGTNAPIAQRKANCSGRQKRAAKQTATRSKCSIVLTRTITYTTYRTISLMDIFIWTSLRNKITLAFYSTFLLYMFLLAGVVCPLARALSHPLIIYLNYWQECWLPSDCQYIIYGC